MNLIELLLERSILKDIGVTLIDSNDQEQFLSYSELNSSAQQILAFLQDMGLNPNDELIIQLEDNKTFIIVFWACIFGGIIPVPLALGTNDDHKQKVFNVWNILNNPYLITTDDNIKRLEKFALSTGQDKNLKIISKKIVPVQQLFQSKSKAILHESNENDIAYVQFSSGSTGTPKGITLTHKNLIANINAILNGIKSPESGDTFFSWMPLTHDMGLIGFHLTPLLAGWHHFIMPTTLFIRRPLLWLQKISEHRVTFTASPNFGYRYVISRLNKDILTSLDLSSLRVIVNGAEPISGKLCKEFTDLFLQCGLTNEVIFPVYGLAEASLAVTFTNPHDPVSSLFIDRRVSIGKKVQEVEKGKGFEVVNVGKVIDNCQLKIVDDNRNELTELTIGKILIKGLNVTKGYYNNIPETKKIISKNGWLDTGDLGFIKNDCLFITGRQKDVIFINGQNYYSHDIEMSLEKIEEIEQGKIVVSAFTNQQYIEEILVFVLNKDKLDKFKELSLKIKKHISLFFGFIPDHIIPVQSIPKTTSGKIQRFKLVELYHANKFTSILEELDSYLLNKVFDDDEINPANETERKLMSIWEKALCHRLFHVKSNFFEVGGNSLKGAQVLYLIHEGFNVNLDYSILFEKLTIRELAKEINTSSKVIFQKINTVAKSHMYEVSSSQKRLYYLWELEKSSIAYNIPLAMYVMGNLDERMLNDALAILTNRHELLRAKFHLKSGLPFMTICDQVDIHVNVSHILYSQLDEEIKKRIKPFDLHTQPLFRAEIMKFPEKGLILFFDIHHIIADGISIRVLLEELLKICANEKLDPTEIQFKDYVDWQFKQEKVVEPTNCKYWSDKFLHDVPILNLPTDHNRPALFDYLGKKLKFSIDDQLTKRLRTLAHQENVSMFILLLTSYNILLSKYTGQEDIIVGVPVAGRNHIQLQPLIGMFVNNLALRNFPKASHTFRTFLKEVKTNVLNDFNHQTYSYQSLLENIGLQRDVSRNPFFDTMFVYQNINYSEVRNEHLSFKPYFFDPGFSKFDITMEMVESEESLTYFLEYATSLFEESSIIKFSEYFDILLNKIVEEPDKKLYDLSLVGQKEYSQSIIEWNDTLKLYPDTKTVHALFQEQVLKTPDRIAVKVGGKTNKINFKPLTYKDLNNDSNQFANYLIKKGIEPARPIAVMLDRTPEFIISVLGILKAGGCYLPIDKDLPTDRIDYIIRNSGTAFLITDTEALQKNKLLDTCTLLQYLCLINIDDKQLYSNETTQIEPFGKPENFCYIIYTSGTTGNPKGTIITHRSLVNYLTWAEKMYLTDKTIAFPLYTSVSFDLTITSLFLPLITGNTIVTYPENKSFISIEEVLEDNQVEIIKVTPSHLKILREAAAIKSGGWVSKLNTFIVGGESFPTQLAQDIYSLFQGNVTIHNEYGPTEATIGCMIYTYNKDIDKRVSVPIGMPINNTAVYILDNYLKSVPQCVVGELYISGDCLSNGYLLNDDLTQSKFVVNPFKPNHLMYKSGDLVKRLSNGQIEFLGRKDKLIKLNGYRIELEEIEKKLLEYPGITDAVVICKKDEFEKEYMIAYVCKAKDILIHELSNEGQGSFVSDVKVFLFKFLPAYMIPRYITEIERIPLTCNGKVDEKLLQVSAKDNCHKEKEVVSGIQRIVLEVWQKNLSNSEIRIKDNFFDLGGDSIKALQISSNLSEHRLYVKAKDILIHQSIEELCKVVTIKSQVKQYEQGILTGEVALMPIYKWFFERDFKNPHFYNQSVLLRFKNKIDKKKIEKALHVLINHHDGLRLNYDSEQNVLFYNNNHLNRENIIQEYIIDSKLINGTGKQFGDKYDDAHSKDLVLNVELENILKKARSSFDIFNTFLMKMVIIRGIDAEMLFITAHHLIIDGISWRIFLNDLYDIYNETKIFQNPFPYKKTASLIDYYNKCLDSIEQVTKSELTYWTKNKAPVTSHGISNSINGHIKNLKKIDFKLSVKETAFLSNESHKAYNTTVEILLIAALLKTIHECTGEKEISIELENHGRQFDDLDFSRTIGWFTSIYPLKFTLTPFEHGNLIKYVKEIMKEVPNGGIGYGILRYLNNRTDIEKLSPGIRFNYLGQFDHEINNDLYSLIYTNTSKDIDEQNGFEKDLDINALILNKELYLEIYYIPIEKNELLIHQIAKKYKANILNILEHIQQIRQPQFTPSDFDAIELNSEDLDVLFG